LQDVVDDSNHLLNPRCGRDPGSPLSLQVTRAVVSVLISSLGQSVSGNWGGIAVESPALWSNTEGSEKRSVRMANDDVPAEADEDSDDELEEADEESFPASDPPASWSGPEES
jgi:hypothetical protein